MRVENNELGLLTFFEILDADYATTYSYSDVGTISSIERNDTTVDIVYDGQEAKSVFLNDKLILESDDKIDVQRRNITPFASNNNSVKTSVSEDGLVEHLQYGLDENMLATDFTYNGDNSISSIDFSNGLKLFAEYDDDGFSSSVLIIPNEDGTKSSIETNTE